MLWGPVHGTTRVARPRQTALSTAGPALSTMGATDEPARAGSTGHAGGGRRMRPDGAGMALAIALAHRNDEHPDGGSAARPFIRRTLPLPSRARGYLRAEPLTIHLAAPVVPGRRRCPGHGASKQGGAGQQGPRRSHCLRHRCRTAHAKLLSMRAPARRRPWCALCGSLAKPAWRGAVTRSSARQDGLEGSTRPLGYLFGQAQGDGNGAVTIQPSSGSIPAGRP